MVNKKNKFYRSSAIFLLTFSLISSLLYVPITSLETVPKVEAGGIPVWDIPAWVKKAIDAVAVGIAKKMVDDITKSTIKWANTGFDGNPAYITDPKGYFGGIASGVIGDTIAKDQHLGFLCSPFQAKIKQALVQTYTRASINTSFQCTLGQIGTNFDTYTSHFSEGGWNSFFTLTQNDANNPYGAYMAAKNYVDQKVASAVGQEQQALTINSGYRNVTECKDRNPTRVTDINFDENYAPGECIRSVVKTPGETIKEGLNTILPSGLNQLIRVQSVEQLVGAFGAGLLNRFVFSSKKGLFSDSSATAATREVIDIDGDGIPDGYDSDKDGQLDICNNGLVDDSKEPSNANCIGSKNAKNSPYLIPICEVTGSTIQSLETFQTFIDRNKTWDPTHARTWQNRTMDAHSAVEDFISTLSRYDVASFDSILNSFGAYSHHLDVMIDSLVTGGDIRNGGLPSDDNITIQVTSASNIEKLSYLKKFKGAINQCSNPDINAINSIPVPTDTGGTGSTNPSGGGPTLSCSPDKTTAAKGDHVIWSAISTYPSATTYMWSGDEVTLRPTSATPGNLDMVYQMTGNKTVSINAILADGSKISVPCSSSVFVTPRASQN